MVYHDRSQRQAPRPQDALPEQLKLNPTNLLLSLLLISSYPVQSVTALHHLEEPPLHFVRRQNSDLPLVVTNNCDEVVYPAILTQSGTGPEQSGFRLEPRGSLSQNVSADWRGRVWGRTNCTFDQGGNAPASGQGRAVCSSGDCGAFVECQGAVSHLPASLIRDVEGVNYCDARAIHPLLSPSSRMLHLLRNPTMISRWSTGTTCLWALFFFPAKFRT